jgi:hypothetical protein
VSILQNVGRSAGSSEVRLLQLTTLRKYAFGEKRTAQLCFAMSAFGGQADISRTCGNVRLCQIRRHQAGMKIEFDPMSALGHKRTLGRLYAMSALHPKADIVQHGGDVRFAPISGRQCAKFSMGFASTEKP